MAAADAVPRSATHDAAVALCHARLPVGTNDALEHLEGCPTLRPGPTGTQREIPEPGPPPSDEFHVVHATHRTSR